MLRPSTPTKPPTLIEVLQRRNPNLTDQWAGKTYSNTRPDTENWDYVMLNDDTPSVQAWTDFTFRAIYLAYGHILEDRLPSTYKPVGTPSPSAQLAVIKKEDDLDGLGLNWFVHVARAPIRVASDALRPQLAVLTVPPNVVLVHKKIQWVNPTNKLSGFKPDWATLDYSVLVRYREDHKDQDEKELAYVIGDSKLKQKWKSEWLALKDGEVKVEMDPRFGESTGPTHNVQNERLLPLSQLSTYCRYAQTRYGYLLTQTELVALRIRRIPRPKSGKVGLYAGIEYASVPWGAYGKDQLTINMAIWALACMGMNDKHREMEGSKNSPLSAMARLTWWKRDVKKQVYQNVISGRQIKFSDWKAEYNHWVKFTDQDGQSFTSTFLPGGKTHPPHPAPTADDPLPGLTQQLGIMNLTQTTGTQQPMPPKPKPHPPNPARPATVLAPSNPQPPKPVAPKPATSKAIPAAGPSNPAIAAAAPREGTCVIGNQTYTATYSKDFKKFQVSYKGKVHLIEYDNTARKYMINDNGKKLYVDLKVKGN